VGIAALTRAEQPGRRELGLREALGPERIAEGAERRGRVPDPEALRGGRVEAPGAEEVAADLGGGGDQLRLVERLRRGVGREQAGAVAVIGRLTAVLVVQLVAEAAREALDRLLERDVVHPLEEGVDVAALAASEAVVQPDPRADVKARG